MRRFLNLTYNIDARFVRLADSRGEKKRRRGDERTQHLVERRHGLDDFLGEGPPDAGGADQHGLQQGLEGLVLVRPWLLDVLE